MILLAQSLLVAWIAARFLGPRRKLLALGVGLLALIPIHAGISTAMALRGLWGDPSTTTLQLVALSLLNATPRALSRGSLAPAIIVAAGLVLYPMALGISDFDPYRLGFQPMLLLAPLACIALAAWWRGHALWLWLLSVDLLVFAAGLPESTNLWDTLLDPLLVVAAAVLLIRNLYRNLNEQ